LGRTTGLRETKPYVRDSRQTPERLRQTMDIFEGTEQIQQLVISRAISGLRIE
jgi:alkylation response protein AidB-like acyl-CoA dehydrogenase